MTSINQLFIERWSRDQALHLRRFDHITIPRRANKQKSSGLKHFLRERENKRKPKRSQVRPLARVTLKKAKVCFSSWCCREISTSRTALTVQKNL